MAGAGDHVSGWHVSSWGYDEHETDYHAVEPETLRKWRVTKDNVFVCLISARTEFGAGEILGSLLDLELLIP